MSEVDRNTAVEINGLAKFIDDNLSAFENGPAPELIAAGSVVMVAVWPGFVGTDFLGEV